MRKTILPLLATTMLSTSAFADVIKCTFTEPFINTVYSMAQQTLTTSASDVKTQITKNVSFQIKGPGKFELVAKNGEVLQELTLNQNGSDGMSEQVYPYEVKAGLLIGGCSSNQLKVKNTDK